MQGFNPVKSVAGYTNGELLSRKLENKKSRNKNWYKPNANFVFFVPLWFQFRMDNEL